MSWTYEHVCKVSASSPLRFLRRKFLNIFFSKIYPLCCHGNQSNSAIWTKFIWIVEDYSRNISVKKNLNICNETAKIANFHFSHCKSMNGNYVAKVLIRLKQKTQLFVPPAYRCYMWNLVRIGFMASEPQRWCHLKMWTDDDGRRMPAYTISSPMSRRLRWANNNNIFIFRGLHIKYRYLSNMVLLNIKSQANFRFKGWIGSKRTTTERNCPAANTLR